MGRLDDATDGGVAGPNLEDQFCLALCRGARAITRAYNTRFEALGITYSQYLVLLTLYAEDALCAGTIAQRVSLDPSSVTPMLRKMEDAQLIASERVADNRRRVCVRLTEKGAALKPAVAAVQGQVAPATGLPSAEMCDLTARLNAIAARLEAAEFPEAPLAADA